MGPILGFFFRDRWDMIGWAVFPRRMSIAELGFILLAFYEIGRLILWASS